MSEQHRVVLVRHGETEWSKSGQHTSRTDIPLTDAGRARARALAPVLAAHPFALVLTSPRRRAIETCELAGFGANHVVSSDLAEWDYGEYEGRTTAEIRREHPGWTLWDDDSPGGETAAEVGARADRVIAAVRALEDDALLFSHGHLLRVLGARWVDLPPTDGKRFALDVGAICVLGWEREQPVLSRWNVTPGDPLAS
jgi:probable phosphoglycerate mutase